VKVMKCKYCGRTFVPGTTFSCIGDKKHKFVAV
jgi:ribosomal protein L24E